MESNDLITVGIAALALLVSVAAFISVQRRERARDRAGVRLILNAGHLLIINYGPKPATGVTFFEHVTETDQSRTHALDILPPGETRGFELIDHENPHDRTVVISWRDGSGGETLKTYRFPAQQNRLHHHGDGVPLFLRAFAPGRKTTSAMRLAKVLALQNQIQRWFR